jgi:hypothetical protein
MHSIAVRKAHGEPVITSVYMDDGMIPHWEIDDFDFGRYPFQVLYTLIDKARYAVASYLGGHERMDDTATEVLEGQIYPVIRKYYPDFKGFEFDKNHVTGDFDFGSVDQQSYGLLQGFLKKTGITLEEFLTDNAYQVIIDGDEYGNFGGYVNAGIIHAEDYTKLYTTSEWFMQGIDGVEVVEV